MPEKKIDSESQTTTSNKCSCCPYGFHIDRDFVRYCDSLYNTAQLDKLRQHKRERRKEKKTVESYLGLGNISAFESGKKVIEVPHKAVTLCHNISLHKDSVTLPHNINLHSDHNAATLPHNFNLHSDGLENAMLDFEDTWQKSLRKSSSSNDIIGKRNGLFKPVAIKPSRSNTDDLKELNKYNTERSRSSSTSSVSSQSTAISCASVPAMSDVSHSFMTSDQMTSSVGTLSKLYTNASPLSPTINRTVLNNIRDQIASSLKRMRELEDQVKCIPVLQVKLYALSEEKKSLVDQLQQNKFVAKSPESEKHLEKQLKRLENEGIMSPTLTRRALSVKSQGYNLSSPGIASCLDAGITNKSFIEQDIISQFKIKDSKTSTFETQRNMRNAGTSCTVLTRDIGIGYVPSKYKSVAVGSDISFKDLINSLRSKKGFDNFTSLSSESLESDSESLPGSDDRSRSFTKSRFQKTAHSTSYTASSIPIKSVVESATNTETRCVYNKSVNTDETPVQESNEKLYKHKSTAASPLMSTKYVQTFDKRTSRNVGLQASLDVRPKALVKYDAAVGDFNINDILCAGCRKIKKSVAVGDFSIKSIICDQCSSLQGQPINTASTHSGNCENCLLRQTETVGVGDYDINSVLCQNCEHLKPELPQKITTHSVGINTSIDSSVANKSGMHICDKCSATIHSVAQGFAANTVDSKIPRPHLKLSIAGKTNHTMLSKLKVQVGKTRKVDRTSPVKDVRGSPIEKEHEKIASTTSGYHMETTATKTNIECQKTLKESDDAKQFSQSSSVTVLPDFTNMPALPHTKRELTREVKAACKVLNDYLQKPERGGEKKTLSSLTIIQNEWFRVANQKKADPLLLEDYLDAYDEFSRLLLHRVVNLSDSNGNTALHYAISYGNFDVVSILIDSKVCDVNKKNKAGYTSIMLVALADMKNDAHHYVVQRLFNIGDINIKATQNGQTALMLAVSHGKKDIVKILLEAAAEINLQDRDGSTALMCAAEHGHLEIIKLLLAHPECDPTLVDNDDCNALTIAMEAGHKDIGLLIYTNMNFSRGSSPYSTLKTRKRSTPRSTPPPRTPTLRTPPLPSPSARSTSSIPSSFQFPS